MSKIMGVIISLCLLANICGCVAVVAGTAGGLGTASWLSGKLSQQLEVSFDRGIKAVESGLKSMRLEISEEVVKRNVAQIRSKYRDGRKIWIDVFRVSPDKSRVEIRAGAFGDKKVAEEVLAAIVRHQ